MKRKGCAGSDSGVSTQHRGITLIELVVVISVVAILVAVSVPAYQDYILRTNRMVAINMALEVGACQQRVYMRTHQYDLAGCGLTNGIVNTPNHEYLLEMRLNRDGQGDPYFTLTANPLGRQAKDSCGALLLTDIGGRGAASAASDRQIDNCWRGRKI